MSPLRAGAFFLGAMMLQWFWNTHLSYWGAAPQFLLAATVLIAARRGPVAAMLVGYVWGLYSDVLRADLFGADALLYALVGYAAGLVRRQIDLQTVAPLSAVVLLLSWLYFVGRGLLGLIFVKSFYWPGWIPVLATPPMNALAAMIADVLWENRRTR